MESWTVELLKIGGGALIGALGGVGSYRLRVHERERQRAADHDDYLRRREVERAAERERLDEHTKLTALLVQHKQHNITPDEYQDFRDAVLVRAQEGESELRSDSEIIGALDVLWDQIWYNRHMDFRYRIESGEDAVPPDVWKVALESAERVKKRRGEENLGPWDDFEWGMLNGKMSALRWVLGDEWDFLDT